MDFAGFYSFIDSDLFRSIYYYWKTGKKYSQSRQGREARENEIQKNQTGDPVDYKNNNQSVKHRLGSDIDFFSPEWFVHLWIKKWKRALLRQW